MLTIAHVLGSFEIGGGERVALDIAAGQQRLGHRVIAMSLAPPPDGPHAQNFVAADIATHRVPKFGPTVDPTLPVRLARLFLREEVDVVHTHNPQPLIYAGPGGKLAGAAVVHTKHGFNAATQRQSWLRRAAARCCDEFVAVSDVTADNAREQRDYPAEQIRVIPNGIELAGFARDDLARAAVRDELGIPRAARVVGTVGRVEDIKNQALLIRAMAAPCTRGAHLIIVGDGRLLAELRELAGQLAHGARMHLVGRRLDVARVISAFDVFALSSRSEGLPLVIPEAMASGLPVVATAVGGVPDVVVEGETGFLVESGDEAALRDRLSRLIDEPARAATLGARGRELALEHYSAERMLDSYMGLYRDVLSR